MKNCHNNALHPSNPNKNKNLTLVKGEDSREGERRKVVPFPDSNSLAVIFYEQLRVLLLAPIKERDDKKGKEKYSINSA
jgi:hypothetical protein